VVVFFSDPVGHPAGINIDKKSLQMIILKEVYNMGTGEESERRNTSTGCVNV